MCARSPARARARGRARSLARSPFLSRARSLSISDSVPLNHCTCRSRSHEPGRHMSSLVPRVSVRLCARASWLADGCKELQRSWAFLQLVEHVRHACVPCLQVLAHSAVAPLLAGDGCTQIKIITETEIARGACCRGPRHVFAHVCAVYARAPSPTLSPTDPVSLGLLTLCPAASSSP